MAAVRMPFILMQTVVASAGSTEFLANNASNLVVFSLLLVLFCLPILLEWFASQTEKDGLVPSAVAALRSTFRREKIWAVLRSGLHVETVRMQSITELAESIDRDVFDPVERRDLPVGPLCGNVTEGHIRSLYSRDPDLADHAVLVVKLASSLLAFGHCSTECESLVRLSAMALGMQAPFVSIGHRQLQVRIGEGPVHVVPCGRDFVFSALSDVTKLSKAIAIGEVDDVRVALMICDKLLSRPLPYGWLVFWLDFTIIAPWAAIAAYYGSYWDMLGAQCISPVVVLTMKVCNALHITSLELVFVPLAIGFTAPLVWNYVSNGGQDICHVLPQIFGAMLIHLPGAQLVWGALEIVQGSVVHGASRLVMGMVQAMLLGIFVVAGWQFFGRGFATGHISDPYSCQPEKNPNSSACKPIEPGVLGALPDTQWCVKPTLAGMEEGTPPYLTWYFVVGLYNIPLNIACLVNVHIRVRDMLGPFLTGQVGLLTLAYLQFHCSQPDCELPSVLINVIAAFFAGSVAMIVEYLTQLPSAISIIPYVLHPPSDCYSRSTIASHACFLYLQRTVHIRTGVRSGTGHYCPYRGRQRGKTQIGKFEDSLGQHLLQVTLKNEAVTYTIGLYAAQVIWTRVILSDLKRRLTLRRRRQAVNDDTDPSSADEQRYLSAIDSHHLLTKRTAFTNFDITNPLNHYNTSESIPPRGGVKNIGVPASRSHESNAEKQHQICVT